MGEKFLMDEESRPLSEAMEKGPARVMDIPLEQAIPRDTQRRSRPQTNTARLWRLDFLAFAIAVVAAIGSLGFWREWFLANDRTIFFGLGVVGLAVALLRANYSGPGVPNRSIAAWVLAIVSVIFGLSALWTSQSILGVLAFALIFTAWMLHRVSGESIPFALGIGLVPLIPILLTTMDSQGAFELIGSWTVSITAGMADMLNQPHVRESDSIIFALGIADQYVATGKWSSSITIIGFALAVVLAFRRALVPAILSILAAVLTWMAIRATAWLIIAVASERNQEWFGWNSNIESIAFAITLLFCICIDFWIASVLAPIPEEQIGSEFPLISFLWNGLCLFPNLWGNLPQTHPEFDSTETD